MGQSEKMEQEDNRPKWLLELENRKRKPRLAHEVGAGAPCMTCSTACPGLDLHFWRKICKNCKCSRDDHDVPNDEFPQFDLLFGPSGKPNKKMIVLKVNKKQAEDEVTFEWAPPDTTKELAADYMKALPEDKLPIKGSAGAALRKQQLQRQLPLHDIDHKVCDELSDSERKQFEKYLENLKKYVGQGKVTKAMGARPFDRALMTPANAADMNRFSPKHKQKQPETQGHRLNLRTPSSFVQKTGYPSSLGSSELTNGLGNRNTNSPLRDHSPSALARFENVRSPAFGQSITEDSPQGRYHRALMKVRNDGEITRSVPVAGTRNPPLNFAGTRTIDDPIANSLANEDQVRMDESVNSCTRNIYNPAVEFAASNMTNEANCGVNSILENLGKTENNQELNYASPGTLGDRKTVVSSATKSTINPETSAALSNSIMNSSSLSNSETPYDEAAIARNREWAENSLLAEKMLNEALLPPSAIHAHDIIGSTLGEEGLSLIREKLTSKYSAKEEPVSLLGPSRSRGFMLGEKRENGAKAKRTDQLRRQGAFDKELDRSDVTQGIPIESDEHSSKQFADNSSLGTEHLHESFDNSAGNGISKENKISDGTRFDETSSNDPRRAIMRGIWENYARPEQSSNDVVAHQDERNSPMNARTGSNFNNNSHVLPTPGCQSVQAELSNCGPGSSYLIQSEELNNQIFPEQARFSSGVVQNPVCVDRLRGAMEEMSVNHPKTQNCHQCRESIRTGDVVVTAEKAQDAFWHPGCFVCSVCNELLADLVYFYYKGKLYCGRDLPTLLEIPRCFACDELIFVREYTVAEGHNYHVKHFCCWDCDVPLAGQQYISENDRPLCLPCYQKTYAKTCSTCQGVIAADQQGVAVKNLNFHANDQCFCCATCKKSLLNGKMAIKEDRPFCSKECITMFLNDRIS